MRQKILIMLLICLDLIFSSCSHKFVKLEQQKESKIIEQVVKVKIYSNGNIDKLTIYTQVDRAGQRAILNGVGSLDKHVFALEVKQDSYVLKDLVNKKEEVGKLTEFSVIPLETDLIFKKIDIKNKQPIIFENNDTRLEITVIEQTIARPDNQE